MSGPRGAASCYLLQADGVDETTGKKRTYSVVMDIGPGSFGELWQYVEPRQIDALLISHGHADHMADVISYHVFLKWHPDGPNGGLPVYGPKEIQRRVAEIDGYDAEGSTTDSFDFKPVKDGQEFTVGPMKFQAFRGHHPVESYGFRVAGPSDESNPGTATFAYTGDTDLTDHMVEMARDVDVLLAEAGFTKVVEIRGVHLTGERAGELAARSGARELVLTHIQPWTDPEEVFLEARSTYAGPLDLAAPGATWIF